MPGVRAYARAGMKLGGCKGSGDGFAEWQKSWQVFALFRAMWLAMLEALQMIVGGVSFWRIVIIETRRIVRK